ncbi:MAG: ATPase [Dysgonamonadaceae bacterium]|jgi:N-acetylglucosamine kinase-like BadF-type ATPase|nr:ATPase [Dysgonamonadaceae bacterium]
MILIADSGSTKTDWQLAEQGKKIRQATTKGMNPYFQTEDEIGNEIRTALLPELKTTAIDALYFYGAGCLPEKIPAMQTALGKHLAAKTVEVNSDMLGAARGLSGGNPGIVCILGTGSNSCFYDGEKITANVSPLGFILGDEGSGAVLGKLLVGDILKNQLPTGLKEKFLQQFALTPAMIIERVYRQPFPNRFLASFSPFLAQHLHEPAIKNLVLNAFKAFLTRNVMQYDYRRYPVHFAGSVAYYYREILAEAMQECEMQLGKISRSPMDGLVEFHKELKTNS